MRGGIEAQCVFNKDTVFQIDIPPAEGVWGMRALHSTVTSGLVEFVCTPSSSICAHTLLPGPVSDQIVEFKGKLMSFFKSFMISENISLADERACGRILWVGCGLCWSWEMLISRSTCLGCLPFPLQPT